MRLASLISLVLLTGGGLLALAEGGSNSPRQKPEPRGNGPRPAAKAEKATTPAEREAAALAFVRANHKELAELLDQLKPMKPDEYDRAIRDLYQASRVLANLKANDTERYERGLEVWKARSRVELLTARLVSAPSSDLESDLRTAIETQVDCEVRQQQLELKRAEQRVSRLRQSLDSVESNRDKFIESRFQRLLKKGQNVRARDGSKPAPAKSARSKGDRKA